MENNTVKELKDVLGIEEWNQIKNKEQFLDLVSYMYSLDEKLNYEILSNIEKLELLIEEFFYDAIDTVIDYEPSIMVAFVDMNSYLINLLEDETVQNSLQKVSHELREFSKWFMVDSKVKYIKASKEYIISIYAALTMIKELIAEEKGATIDISLLSERRDLLLKDLKDLVEFGIDFQEENYYEEENSYDSQYEQYELEEDDDDDYLN